jgi:hypothetical protein
MVQAAVSGRPCHQRLAASNTAVSNSAKEADADRDQNELE